jgi:hypothetical protein
MDDHFIGLGKHVGWHRLGSFVEAKPVIFILFNPYYIMIIFVYSERPSWDSFQMLLRSTASFMIYGHDNYFPPQEDFFIKTNTTGQIIIST